MLPTPKARSEEEISPRQKRARIELDESRTRPPVCAKSTKDQKKKRKKEDRKMQVWFARLAAATTKRLDGMCRLFFPRGGRRRERCRFLFVVEPRSFGQRTRFSKKAGGDPTLLGNAKKQSRRIKRATGRERKSNSSKGGRNRVAADTDAATISYTAWRRKKTKRNRRERASKRAPRRYHRRRDGQAHTCTHPHAQDATLPLSPSHTRRNRGERERASDKPDNTHKNKQNGATTTKRKDGTKEDGRRGHKRMLRTASSRTESGGASGPVPSS